MVPMKSKEQMGTMKKEEKKKRKERKWFCVEKKGKKEKKKKEMECVVSNHPKNIRKDNPKIIKLPIYPYIKI